MSIGPAEFDNLLDLRQAQMLLDSVAELNPLALFILTTQGDMRATAQSVDIPPEVIGDIQKYVDIDESELPIAENVYVVRCNSITIEEQTLGYVMAIALASDAQHLAVTINLVNHTLTQQLYKEYELNGLTTELLDKYEEINLLYELSQDLGVIFDIKTICNTALERALEIIKAREAFIALMDEDEQNLTVMATKNVQDFEGWKIPVGQGVSGNVAQTGKHIVLQAQQALPDSPNEHELTLDAVLSVPLVLPATDYESEDKILGVMTFTGRPEGEIFTAGDAQLATTIMTQVTVAIHNSRLAKTLRASERVQQQVEIASRIQQSLLPKQPPQLSGVSLVGQCVPTTKVGGDYYDYLVDVEGRLTLLIADASGHSIGSALMITMARSILRHEIIRGQPLGEILTDINRVMLNDLVKAEMFISLFCARYNPDTQQLSYVNAGHNPPFILRAATEEIEELNEDTGFILGVLDDVVYQEHTISLNPGDILLLYTDGITEARDPNGQQFGEVRLQKVLKKYHSLSPDKLRQKIYQKIRHYIEDAPQHDDITLLILKVE